MHAEVIAIGDEITSGQLLDTNTQWLSQRLEEMGVRVLYHSTVGDELEPIAGVFRLAIKRADVVISTGGLGPTADDLTRHGLARATDRKLLLDEAALEHIRAMHARRKRPMPKRNEQQAMFPEGGRLIRNPNGTAPGIFLEVPREGSGPCRVFTLPGVPAEMREMWHQGVSQQLKRAGAGLRMVRHRRIKCFGAGESQIEAMLPDLIRRGRDPRVGINASKTTIILRITAEGATEEECYAAMKPTIETIRSTLGNLVFGEDDDELQHAVARLLRQQNKSLSTAEWGTGGMVAGWLDEVVESDGCYLGGVVVHDEGALEGALGVPGEFISRHTAISAEVAEQMAAKCRERFETDLAVAAGRFPRYAPRGEEPEPTYFALATPEGVRVKSVPFAGHPATLKVFSAKYALNMVRLELLGEP